MTREQKALRIAELEGWELRSHKIRTIAQNLYISKEGARASERYLIKHFSHFNGLMEIVERANNNYYKTNTRFEISNLMVSVETHSYWKYFDLENDSNYSLIDALQDAVIYYLQEVKNNE